MEQNNTCCYCETQFTDDHSDSRKTLDHIIPLSKGGINEKINKIECCAFCNGLKGNRTPDEFTLFLEAGLYKMYRGKVKSFLRIFDNREKIRIIINNNNALINKIEPYRKQLFRQQFARVI